MKTLLDDKLKAIVSNTVKLYGQALASDGQSPGSSGEKRRTRGGRKIVPPVRD